MNDTSPTPETATPTTSGVLVALGKTRSAIRRALVIERLSQAIAFGLLAIVLAVVLDRLLRLPPFIRVIELAMLVGGGFAWFALKVLPAFRFSPSLVEVALWLERGNALARGKLAAGADLAQSQVTPGRTGNPLASMVIDEAEAVSHKATYQRVNQQPVRRAAAAAGFAVVTLVLLVIFAPETSKTALLRLMTPFADIQWPARTMVEPAMASLVHPRGVALSLRAQSVRGDAADMRVEAEYRLLRDGDGEWRKVLLSAQPDGAFERLVETDGESIEVLFRTEDMETLPIVIRLVPPPVVESARAVVTPPPYLSGKVDVRTIELGTGTDRRATVSPPVLTGSTINIDMMMRGTSAVPTEPSTRALWLTETISLVGVDGTPIAPQFTVDDTDQTRWSMSWVASGRGVLELKPRGADGILPSERIAFEIPAIDDAPPVITIVEPTADETVTPAATPLVVAEGRDDFGVKRSWIDVSVTRNDAPSRRVSTVEGSQGTNARVETTLLLSEFAVEPGDRVVCVGSITDAFENNGSPRSPVVSSPRVFRVISASELSAQVRSRLGQMREAAGRLREEQAGIADAIKDVAERTKTNGATATEAERAQVAGSEGRMADRIAAFERSLAELASKLERNKTDGEGLSETIQEASELARTASQRSQEGATALPDAGLVDKAAERASESESALADLETALQRDRETAELTRRIDKLAERIDVASKDTRAAAEKSVGKQRNQLSEETKALMDRSAQAQREAAAEARALAEDLGKRAEEIQKQDKPDEGAAEAMREAQQEADNRGLARQLEQAAQQTEQNQMQGAQQSQQQAQQAVQAMQQAMKNQSKRRTEELERRITDVVDALRSLLGTIETNTLTMQKLTATDVAEVSRLAKLMLQLSRNASGIAENAGAAGQPMRRATTLIIRGAEQLDAVAASLRKEVADVAQAQESLEAARTSIQEALASAQKAKNDAEKDAENLRREELRGVYEQVLERQRSARSGAEAIVPAPGKTLDRRGFVESKRIAAEQATVTGLLTTIGARGDVSGSELYATSNQEMISASTLAGQDLAASALSRRTVLVQREVEASLASLIEALADPPEADDPFAEAPKEAGGGQQPPGGGSAAGAPRVPPMAELRLLRTMAQRVLDDTKSASELPDPDRAAYLSRIATRQKRLMELGERWVKAMEEQSRGPDMNMESPNTTEAPTTGGSDSGAKP
jgi:hypothetical protein